MAELVVPEAPETLGRRSGTGPAALVSVVLPVYNPGRFLDLAIWSILRQSHRHLELILVDDGSSDGSSAVCDRWAARDQRVTVIHQANAGIVAALEAGIARTRGPFIARMDADDVSHPHRLRDQLAEFARHPEAQVVGSDYLLIDPDGRRIGRRRMPRCGADLDLFLAFGNPFGHPTVLMRSDWLRRHGYRAPPEQQVAEDLSLWVRGWAPGAYRNLPVARLWYRMHGGQLTASRWAALQRARLTATTIHALRFHQRVEGIASVHGLMGLAACWARGTRPSAGVLAMTSASLLLPVIAYRLDRLRRRCRRSGAHG